MAEFEGLEASTDEPGDRRGPWISLLITVVFGAAAMVYSLEVWRFQIQWEHHLPGGVRDVWFTTGDVWGIVDAGRMVWHGALGSVYPVAPGTYALPLSFILAAPVAALIDHFNLVEGLVPLARPSAWYVVGPFVLAFNIFVLDAVRRLAWQLGLRRRLGLLQLWLVPVVLMPGFEWGHFEDLLALSFVVHSTRYLLTRDYVRAGLFISVAVCFKQWAVLLIPLVVLIAPAGRRLRSTLACCGLPALLGGLVVLANPTFSISTLLSPTNLGQNTPGHLSFYATWLGSKTSRASRTTGVIVSVFGGWLLRRRVGSPRSLLLAVSLVLLVRPLFEAITFSYYWSPSFVFAGLVGVAAHRRVRLRDWIWQAIGILWALPHGNPNMAGWWWAAMSLLLVLVYGQAAVNCGLEPRVALGRLLGWYTGLSSKRSAREVVDRPVEKEIATAGSERDVVL